MAAEFRELVEKERFESKERMKKESSGIYVLFYIWAGFYVLASGLWGFKYESMKDTPYYTLFVMAFLLFQPFNRYLYNVREDGKYINIFQKYKYIPVNLKQIVLVKLILISKNILIPTAMAQAAALLIRILDLDKDGGRISYITVWMPVIFGVIMWIIIASRLLIGYKKTIAG